MIDTKAIRIDIDKPRKPQLLWLTSTLVKALDEVDRLREDYRDLAWQSCPVREDGVVDSCAIPAYAYAMKQLGKTGDLIIDSDIGKRVMGHWVEDKP
ncbi:hypothetical protein LCGC14_3150740 [marine sediment metagenome]|uniref:Uncharacterized protein n=1 Tax=marine sediment metagenome TaxID=412755 RepID=A0A0F8WI99_9ZZZZ